MRPRLLRPGVLALTFGTLLVLAACDRAAPSGPGLCAPVRVDTLTDSTTGVHTRVAVYRPGC